MFKLFYSAGSLRRMLDPTSSIPQMQVAQFQAIAREAPLFYIMLWLTLGYVTFVYWSVAPDWLVLPPILLATPVCLMRSVHYLRHQSRAIEPDEATRRLGTMTRFIRTIMLASGAWVIALAQFGSDLERMHILCFIILQSLFSLLGLLHIPKTALQVAAAFIPVALYLLVSGSATIAVAAGVYLMMVAVSAMLTLIYSDVFLSRVLQHHQLERLSAENLLLANTDLLTGLPNRRNFFSELETAFKARDVAGAIHLGFVDLDGFKPINDTYGHPVGDAVLVEVGRRLAAFSDRCLLARLGGDEFGVLFHGMRDEAAALAEAICESLRQPYRVSAGIVNLGATAGLAAACDAQGHSARLIEIADYALYQGKAKRRGTVVVFDGGMEQALHRRILIERALRDGDLESELSLAFQPIVSVPDHRPVAFEALARWHSPLIGNIPPQEFIAVAESYEMVSRLTEILFRKSLAAAALWPAPVALSFNLSAHDLVNPRMARVLTELIERSGIDPSRIVFELTETALVRDFAKAQATLNALKPLGVSFALDDFGTGYSSLSYVHKLPIDRLKIDKTFTTDLVRDQGCRNVVQSVIGLARTLRLQCVAEGVETPAQMGLLEECGCELLQGYWFGRPMGEQDVASYLAGQSDPAQPPALRGGPNRFPAGHAAKSLFALPA